MCLFAEKDSMTHANGPILGYVLFRRLEPEIVGLDDVSMSSAHCWVVLTSLSVFLTYYIRFKGRQARQRNFVALNVTLNLYFTNLSKLVANRTNQIASFDQPMKVYQSEVSSIKCL